MAVELQLGLALPTGLITAPISIKRSPIDLNCFESYPDDVQSDASTKFHGSSMSICDPSFDRIGSCSPIMKKNMKRSFDESSEADSGSADSPLRTLPLFRWNKQPKDDDDLPDCGKTCNLNLIKNRAETEGIVGWPPIKTYRKKQRGHDRAAARYGGGRGRGGSNCLFVKAQIEGTLITRKIDLSHHRSYRTLSSTLLFMFGRGHESVDEYSLTYQDNQGHWALADNVPWRTFIESVLRLRLIRKED